MINRTRNAIVVACLLALSLLVVATLNISNTSAQTRGTGTVYVMTNQVNNAVAVFKRASDGTLTPVGVFSTGGSGNPVAQPGDPPTDPLASQGSLILSEDNT